MKAWQASLSIWLRWMLATSIPGSAAFAVVTLSTLWIFRETLDRPGFVRAGPIDPLLFWLCGLVAVIAPAVGLSQALILRNMDPPGSWWLWAIATTIGVLVSVLATTVLISSARALALMGIPWLAWMRSWLVWVPLSGALIGFAQWRVLRVYVPGAIWWIPGNALACLIVARLGYLTYAALPVITALNYPFQSVEQAVAWTIAWAVALCLLGSITGTLLTWLLLYRPAVAPFSPHR